MYAWLNENFRKEFRLIIPWIFTSIKWCKKPNQKNDKTNEQEDGDAEMCEMSKYVNQTTANLVADVEQELLPVHKNNNNNHKNNNNLNSQKNDNNLKYKNFFQMKNLKENQNLNNNDDYFNNSDNFTVKNNNGIKNEKSNSQ